MYKFAINKPITVLMMVFPFFPSFPSSCLGMPIGGRDLKKGYFNQNTRRYGTVKRLGQKLSKKDTQ